MSTTALPDLNTLDREALKALVITTHERLLSRESEIEHLKLVIAKLRRMQFGHRSEKVQRQIEQLELRLEDLEAKQAASQAKTESVSNLLIVSRPARRPLPEHLPRETHKHESGETVFTSLNERMRLAASSFSHIRRLHPAVLRLPAVVRLLADAMLTA